MIVTTEMIKWIVGVAVAIFWFGYEIGHALGKSDGEASVADYYSRRLRK